MSTIVPAAAKTPAEILAEKQQATIAELLKQLERISSENETQASILAARKTTIDDQIKKSIPPALLAQLDRLAEDQKAHAEGAVKAMKLVEDRVKEEVLAFGQSFKGDTLHAVFNGGPKTWDGAKLEGYAAVHPEILQFRKQGKASVAIKVIK